MATCNYIPAKKQTRGAIQAVIKYVSQDEKTRESFFFDLRQEVNGQIGEIENLLSKMKKWILWTLLTNVGLTTAVSLLIGYLIDEHRRTDCGACRGAIRS